MADAPTKEFRLSGPISPARNTRAVARRAVSTVAAAAPKVSTLPATKPKRQTQAQAKPKARAESTAGASASGSLLTTLSRGLAILEFVAHSHRFVRLRDVAEHFDMDRSSALRFLRTLEATGYVVRHEAMKVYSVGPRVLTFPRLAASTERVIALARPELEKLGRSTGQIAHLATLNGLDAVLVEVVASDAPVSVKQAVGDLEPLYSSAVGKAIYAFMPEAERETLSRRIEFAPFTTRTILNVRTLEEEVAAIRASGVAFDRQEGNDHVSCVGSPILNADGVPVAAIGLSYVSAHLEKPIDEMIEHLEMIKEAARTVELALRG